MSNDSVKTTEQGDAVEQGVVFDANPTGVRTTFGDPVYVVPDGKGGYRTETPGDVAAQTNPDHPGFDVGVLRIEWVTDPDREPWTIPGRLGKVWPALIAECRTKRQTLDRDAVHAALLGVVVRGPDGHLAVIRGVESPATMSLYVDVQIGLLLDA